jgi:uncharacterized protein YggE
MFIQELYTKKKDLFAVFFVIILLLFLALTILVGVKIVNEIKEGRYIGQGIEAQNTINVSGTGKVYAKPDLVLITLSIISEEKTVDEALSDNTEKTNQVIEFIKGQGIEEKDIKTISFNIYPRYEWRESLEIPPYPQGERVLVGYEVHQSLQVKIRDMEKIGNIIQGATEAGANQISNLQLTIDKEDEFQKEAREQAIEKAKEKAQELASQLGVNLVRITNFQESSVLPVPRPLGLEETISEGMGGGGEVPQIEAGENLIQVSVIVTYEIN